MRGAIGSIVEAVYPSRCAGCGAPGSALCPGCLADVIELRPPGCLRCGRPLAAPADGCPDCPPPPLAWSRSALLYAGPVRAAMMRLKFSGWRGAAVPFVPALAAVAREAPIRSIRPVLTWVPLGRRRKRARGFDQAQALARVLSRETGWPAERLLRRDRETDPQARRGAFDRRTALAGAFSAAARPPPLVVVVDDVLTTGATAAACAEVLVEAGARTVGLVTLARALGGPLPQRPVAASGDRAPSA